MVGETDLVQLPLPVPVTVPPELLKVNDQAPEAVIVPLNVVLEPAQIVALPLVMAATGRAFTATVAEPVKSEAIEAQETSVKEAIV